MRKKFLLPYVLVVILILSACSSPGGFKAEHAYDIKPFEFTNQHNEKVSLDDLKGGVWLAQFVFTNCTTVCGPMMFNMSKIQHELIESGVEDYKIVSFSVDPDFDTPEVLQTYLDSYAAAPGDDEQKWDESKWEMLTGYTQKEIADISAKSFKMPVAAYPETSSEAGQVLHGTRFALVNQEGKVVKSYNGAADVPFDEIVKDMKALIKAGA